MKQVCIKQRYASAETARHVLKVAQRKNKRGSDEVYECRNCNAWHISFRGNGAFKVGAARKQ